MPQPVSAPLLRAAYRILTCLQPRQTTQFQGHPQVALFEGRSTQPQPHTAPVQVPPTLWTYWDAEPPDSMVLQCIDNWRAHCPGFDVHVLNRRNLGEYIPPVDLPRGFDALHPTKQSDWVRLYVIRHHGGYWLDATILLTQSPRWLDNIRMERQAEFAGFYLQGYTQDPQFPVIESWAFAAPAGSAFVTAWQKEFHSALIDVGTEAYLTALRARSDGATLLQGIADPAYLLIHVAAQQVLRRENGYTLALFKAEDTAFFYQKSLRWKWYLLYPRLCLLPAEAQPAPLVKLRGGERRHFAELLDYHGGAVAGSIWQRACRPIPRPLP